MNDQTEASPNPDDETKDEAAEQIPDEAADRPEASEPASSESDTDPSADEDLPEWEPLTPELVEDEAIRGDFMLRWAVILLALLMGWTVIQDSAVLTHIKSGEAIAANGYLPPRTDPLSSTAAESTWVNLSWIWDLTVAGVYGFAGGFGLTLLKAVLAGLILRILSCISLPGLPTWWGSVCGVLALVTLYPDLTATPAIVTGLGMVLLLALLPLGHTEQKQRSLWLAVPLLIIWNQLDPRAWIGLATLLLFAAGHWWDTRKTDKSTEQKGPSTGTVAAVSILAFLVHPFLWNTLTSAVELYQIDYPVLRAYANRDVAFAYQLWPIWADGFWQLSYFNAAGLLLWATTVVTLVLNAERVPISHFALFVISTALVCFGGGEFGAASLLNAVLATLNAQAWYRASFRQTYSVEPAELLFSRGGRAVTVIAFFAIGFGMVSGHLTGADGRRVGTGFDRSLGDEIASYREILSESFDDRPFNFRLEQGDILNWISQKPFVDSRVRLFGSGSPSIIDDHLAARVALRTPSDEAKALENRAKWIEIFDRHEITHVLPRLTGAFPDYRTFNDLKRSPDWEMTNLGAATASFYRTDQMDPELLAFVDAHQIPSPVERIFRTRDEEALVVGRRTTWPQPPSVYDRYMYLKRSPSSNAIQLARHHLALSDTGGSATSVGDIVAVLFEAIRRTHDGLAEHPNDPTAYSVLGSAYGTLWDIERGVMQRLGMPYPGTLRYFQTIAAYHHLLQCDPDNEIAHFRLAQLYLRQQRQDLGLHHLKQFEQRTGRLAMLTETDPNYEATQQQLTELMTSISDALAESTSKLQDDLIAGADRVLLAQSADQSGFPMLALQTLEDDLTTVSGNPTAAVMYGRLLMEVGRTREAYDQLQGVKQLAEQQQSPGDWPVYVAICEVIAEDLHAALATLQREHQQLTTGSAALLMQFGPLRSSVVPVGEESPGPLAPVSQQAQSYAAYTQQLLPRIEANALRQGLIQLELGQNADASSRFRQLIEQDPVSGYRPLTETYVGLLESEPSLPPVPDQQTIEATIPELTAENEETVEPATEEEGTPSEGDPQKPEKPADDQEPQSDGSS